VHFCQKTAEFLQLEKEKRVECTLAVSNLAGLPEAPDVPSLSVAVSATVVGARGWRLSTTSLIF
jgi:hypothetical protein